MIENVAKLRLLKLRFALELAASAVALGNHVLTVTSFITLKMSDF